MKQDTYQSLGLSPNEWKIYEKLVELGESSIGDISVAAQIHRRNAYDAMHRLIEKGLCFQIISPAENRYNAVDPDKLTELMKEKESDLESLLPDLKKKFKKRVAPEEAYIYRGYEGQKNVWRHVIEVGKPSYMLGGKGQWFDPFIATARKKYFEQANKKGIVFHTLFDYELKEALPNFMKDFPGKLRYRILPKTYSTTSATHIFGDFIVTNTGLTKLGFLSKDMVFFVIRSQNLADSYRKWFQYMWDQSKEHK